MYFDTLTLLSFYYVFIYYYKPNIIKQGLNHLFLSYNSHNLLNL
jgi:hypothetical protein